MRYRGFGIAGAFAAVLVLVVNLTAPPPAEAIIHEIVAAMCRAGGEELEPRGQERDGQSLARALQASGFITNIDTSDPTKVVISFDASVPNSKFIALGFDLTIPNAIAPGVALVLSPLVIPDPNFPAHANCRNLNP